MNVPKVPQAPSRSGASARSTASPEESTPDPASVPREIVSGTVVVEKEGPPLSAIV